MSFNYPLEVSIKPIMIKLTVVSIVSYDKTNQYNNNSRMAVSETTDSEATITVSILVTHLEINH